MVVVCLIRGNMLTFAIIEANGSNQKESEASIIMEIYHNVLIDGEYGRTAFI